MPDNHRYAVHAYACSDMGRVRRTNEDSFLVSDLTKRIKIEKNGILKFESGPLGALFAVADGMGGAVAGETASLLSLKILYSEILDIMCAVREENPGDFEQVLIDAIGIANRNVFAASRRNQKFWGMGTTLTTVLEVRGQLAIAQVGDSRAYLIRNDNIRQLTRDQSLIAQKVSEGQLTEEQARRHPDRNILLQALGVSPTVELGIQSTSVFPKDIILLCSDGLHSQVSADEICEIAMDSANLRDACLELIELANSRGGPDNITAVLAQFLP